MQITKPSLITILCISVLANVVLGFLVSDQLNKEYARAQEVEASSRLQEFRDLFDEKILLSDKEVDFETRLQLETAVRNLNDPQVLAQWEKFTQSTSKEEATVQARNLLGLLIKKSGK